MNVMKKRRRKKMIKTYKANRQDRNGEKWTNECSFD